MRTIFAALLALAGAVTSGAAYVRSNGRIRPASEWSLAERLGALRVERTLPGAVRKQATFALRGDHALFKVREPTGPVLLKCGLRGGADVTDAFLSYATGGTPAGCEMQAVDEVGDLLIYEVSGRVTPLCPGQYATLTEQQLHDALFLPALKSTRRGPQGGGASESPAAVLQPGKLETCTGGEANCAISKAASALIYCGVVRTCAEGACFQGQTTDIHPDDVAASLYYYQALAQAKTPSSIAPAARKRRTICARSSIGIRAGSACTSGGSTWSARAMRRWLRRASPSRCSRLSIHVHRSAPRRSCARCSGRRSTTRRWRACSPAAIWQASAPAG